MKVVTTDQKVWAREWKCGIEWERGKEESVWRIRVSKRDRMWEEDICKCVYVRRKWEREKEKGEQTVDRLNVHKPNVSQCHRSRQPCYVLITHVKPIITLQGHLLTGKMKPAHWSKSEGWNLSHWMKIIVSPFHFPITQFFSTGVKGDIVIIEIIYIYLTCLTICSTV